MSEASLEGEGYRGPSDEELRRAVPQGSSGHQLRVGVFVILGILASVLVLYVTTDPGTFRGRYSITTRVDDAGGLRRGDPVQMRGVNIGRVDGFAMAEGAVVITLEIEGEWRIPADSRTRLVSTSLLGGKTVEVIPGDSEQSARRGGHLPGSSAGDVFDDAAALTGEAQEVLVRIRTLLSAPTVSSIQASARELESLLSGLNELTEAQRDEVARLTESLNRAAEGVEDVTTGPELRRAVARADSTFLALNQTSVTLRQTTETLQLILERMERGEGTLGQLSVNDTLYDNLARTLDSLDRLLVDLRENPGRYIKLEIF